MLRRIAVGVSLITALAIGSMVSAELSVAVLISPHTLLLGTVQSTAVTVHAEIPYNSVETGTLTLGGVPATFAFADSRGELVAKFPEDEIKSLLAPGFQTLTLYGQTKEGEPFSGSDVVQARLWR